MPNSHQTKRAERTRPYSILKKVFLNCRSENYSNGYNLSTDETCLVLLRLVLRFDLRFERILFRNGFAILSWLIHRFTGYFWVVHFERGANTKHTCPCVRGRPAGRRMQTHFPGDNSPGLNVCMLVTRVGSRRRGN